MTEVKRTSFYEVTTQTNKYEVRDITAQFLPYLEGNKYDVNGDEEVNIADVNMILDIILTSSGNMAGDVNGDDEVNIADVNDEIAQILK